MPELLPTGGGAGRRSAADDDDDSVEVSDVRIPVALLVRESVIAVSSHLFCICVESLAA
jgi:hypothetical protein